MKLRVLNLYFNLNSKFCSTASAAQNAITINFYTNPCVKFSQYLQIPLLKEYEDFFSPSVKAMYAAQDLFTEKKYESIELIKKSLDPIRFPDHSLPEVMFFGKSNAGKSSLLKAILRNYPIDIHVSKRPGHTRTARFYNINSKLCIVDMPGYGLNQPMWYDHCVGGYLKYRRNLVRAFFVVDGKVGFDGEDESAMGMLESTGTPYALVMTKIDSASDGHILRNLIHLKQIKDRYYSQYCFPQPFLVSSTTYEGMAHLLAFIGHITGNLSVE